MAIHPSLPFQVLTAAAAAATPGGALHPGRSGEGRPDAAGADAPQLGSTTCIASARGDAPAVAVCGQGARLEAVQGALQVTAGRVLGEISWVSVRGSPSGVV